jgi:hypothetical protein
MMAVSVLLFAGAISARAADAATVLAKVSPLPVALSDDFEFRKVKLFQLGQTPSAKTSSALKKRLNRGSGNRPTAVVAEASIRFEGSYRNFGAVTSLDQRQRAGNYLDFYWSSKRDAPVTLRLEYRQELLRSFVQGREISYPHARGHHKTEFAIIGDNFWDDGRVTAWRCLIIENGHVVAEKRSYLWN